MYVHMLLVKSIGWCPSGARPRVSRSLAGGDKSTSATETEGLSERESPKEYHPEKTLDLRTRLGLARTELQATVVLSPDEPSLELSRGEPMVAPRLWVELFQCYYKYKY